MSILEHAARASRYSQAELSSLDFDGSPPDAAALSRRWHALLDDARSIVGLLPSEQAGRAVLAMDGQLFRGGPEDLREAIARGGLEYHEGRIHGAFPRLLD